MKMKTPRYLSIVLACFSLMIFISCKQRVDEKSSKQAYSSDQIKVIPKEEVYIPAIIPPSDIIYELNALEVDMDPGHVNPVTNITKYTKHDQKVLALGCYVVDFAYLANLDEPLLIPEYFKTIKSLSDDLRISGFIPRDIWNRIDENKHHPDSIIEFSNEVHKSVVELLQTNYQNDILSMLLIGSFVETIYLISQNLDYEKDIDVAEKLFNNQRIILDDYLQLTNSLLGNPYVKSIIDELKPLIDFFNALRVTTEDSNISKDNSGQLTFSGGDQISLNPEDLKLLNEITIEVRAKFFLIN